MTDVLYKKSLVNHLFSFDLDKNLILDKNRSFDFLQKTNIKIYEPNDNNNESKLFGNSEKTLSLKNTQNNINRNNKPGETKLKEVTIIKKRKKENYLRNILIIIYYLMIRMKMLKKVI